MVLPGEVARHALGRISSRLSRLPQSCHRRHVGEIGSSVVDRAFCRRGRLIAAHALELDAEPRCSPFRARDPVADLPWRVVPDVLAMAALKLGDPVPFFILVVPDDRLLHGRSAQGLPPSSALSGWLLCPSTLTAGIADRTWLGAAVLVAARAGFPSALIGSWHWTSGRLELKRSLRSRPIAAQQTKHERVLDLAVHVVMLAKVSLALEAEPLEGADRRMVSRVDVGFEPM
jgi:hypothetical protein